MEAPYKIYIPQRNIEAGTIQELCELIVEGSVEYIRKDALLKWAEQEKSKTSIGLSEYDAGHENGRMELLNDLIDKISTL